jgi:uncharacterized protein YggT (Ycf19 family)
VWLICWVIQIYIIVCIVRVALSWLDLQGGGTIFASIGTIAYSVTEPVFRMVRSRMPKMGDLPVDLSPAIVIIGLGVLREIICSLG